MSKVAEMLSDRRVVVCCGAGGVGKTTVSASLAVAAARAGRRVLVVTIDPSKRLAESLGVDRNPADPIAVEHSTLIPADSSGSLAAWMLDPQLISDNVVRRFSGSARDASNLLSNRIYRNVTAMVAGMQEYTAVQALYEFVNEDRYDLVVLDTPPSRDALRFLDAPDRATAFLDRRIFNLFVSGEGGPIRRVATRLLEKVMDFSFGRETRLELQQFFQLFGTLLTQLNHNQAEMRRFLTSDAVAFVLVTSPAEAALTEARFFAHRASQELALNVAGVVLNRSLAHARHWEMPSVGRGRPLLKSALAKLMPMAERERDAMAKHWSLARELGALTDDLAWVCALPNLGSDASHLDGLVRLAHCMIEGSATLASSTMKDEL